MRVFRQWGNLGCSASPVGVAFLLAIVVGVVWAIIAGLHAIGGDALLRAVGIVLLAGVVVALIIAHLRKKRAESTNQVMEHERSGTSFYTLLLLAYIRNSTEQTMTLRRETGIVAVSPETEQLMNRAGGAAYQTTVNRLKIMASLNSFPSANATGGTIELIVNQPEPTERWRFDLHVAPWDEEVVITLREATPTDPV